MRIKIKSTSLRKKTPIHFLSGAIFLKTPELKETEKI